MGKAHGNSLHQAYYAVIVADVRYDKTLKPNAKLLYGELTALCNQYGYCWATNEYFADLYGLAPATVSRLISQLESRGYIRCEMAATETGSERRIYAGAFVVRPLTGGIDENVKTPLDENVNTPLDEIVNPQYENNINISPYSPPELSLKSWMSMALTMLTKKPASFSARATGRQYIPVCSRELGSQLYTVHVIEFVAKSLLVPQNQSLMHRPL